VSRRIAPASRAANVSPGEDEWPRGNSLVFEREDGGTHLLWVSPPRLIERALDLAGVGPWDVVYDLGAADGRVVALAAARGARAVGIEAHEQLADFAQNRVESLGDSAYAAVEHGDFRSADLSPATVIYVFLGREDLDAGLARRLGGAVAGGARLLTVDLAVAGLTASRDRVHREGKSRYRLRLYERASADASQED
jgi:hypothetical protein